MAYRRTSARHEAPAPRVPLWRVMLVSVGLFWFFATVVFVVTQWAAPAFYSSAPTTTSGFNFGQSLGVPIIKTWGLWLAGALFLLGPFAAVWMALERGGEAVMGKALGITNTRRRRR